MFSKCSSIIILTIMYSIGSDKALNKKCWHPVVIKSKISNN